MHLGGNMLFLWIFGDNLEDQLGHMKFLAFYFAGGLVAALCLADVLFDFLHEFDQAIVRFHA